MRIIKKIVKIKNFPSFVDYKPIVELPEFSKYNLIHGWNGSGKTTFSRVLRSFELEANEYNDLTNPSDFEFKLSDGSSIGSSDLSAFKEIRVFNKDFIEDSVFCEGGPKPIFFLGKQSKEDKEKIIKIEEYLMKIRADLEVKRKQQIKVKDNRDKLLSLKAREIKDALTTSLLDKYRNYEKDSLEKAIKNYATKPEDKNKIALTTDKLITLKKVILQTSGKKLHPIAIPDFDISNLENITKEVLKKSITSQVIDSLKSNEEISKWIEHGLIIHKSNKLDTCAFCNQKIPQERMAVLENHFNDEYQKTIETIKEIKSRCVLREINVNFPDSSSFYDDVALDYVLEKEAATKIIEQFNTRLKVLIVLLEQKEKNLFIQPVLVEIKPIDTSPFSKINELIKKHNEKTSNFEKQISNDKEVLELHSIAEFIPTYNSLEMEIRKFEKDLKTVEETVKTKEQEVKNLKESLISHHIPAKEINESLEKFLGRTDIQLKTTEAKDGYQITRNGVVAKNLSEGESTALGIVYFITKIKEDGFDLKNSVIVIDDPVSSLDSNAIFLAFSFLKEAIKDAGQIFILTHHFDFFRQVKNWFKHPSPGEKSSYFMISCRNDSGVRKSEIVPIDKLLIKYESEYHFLFSILHRFAKKGETDLEELYPLPNIARKFLESFLAFRVPILKESEPNIFFRLKEIAFDEIGKTRIYRFVETHSHPRYESGLQDFDMTILSETSAIIEDILKMVEVEDKKHYDFLIKSLST